MCNTAYHYQYNGINKRKNEILVLMTTIQMIDGHPRIGAVGTATSQVLFPLIAPQFKST